jgi:hypothetical protein
VTACQGKASPYELYSTAIQPGMSRATAIQIIGGSAWYHQDCSYGEEGSENFVIDDLFFFGSHQYDEADILIIVSRVHQDELVVDLLGTYEPNAWHTAYRDCVQRDRFED